MIIQIKSQQKSTGNRKLPSRFPFRVCYAVTKGADQELLLKTLRYAALCPVTDSLLEVLHSLIFTGERCPATAERPTPVSSSECRELWGGTVTPEDWTFVVPVHPGYVREEYNGRSALSRVFRSEIWARNTLPEHALPPISLHLPERVIPNMCVACLNVIDMQDGTCYPGSPVCQLKMQILVRPEETHAAK